MSFGATPRNIEIIGLFALLISILIGTILLGSVLVDKGRIILCEYETGSKCEIQVKPI